MTAAKASQNVEKNQSVDLVSKLKDLQKKRHHAAKINHKNVVEEERIKKMSTNWQKKEEKLKSKLEYEQFVKQCKLEGKDPTEESWKNQNIAQLKAKERIVYEGSEELARMPEFRAGIRYQHLVSKMKPDQEVYDIQKLEQGENFFPDSNTSLTSKPVDRPEDVDKLVNLYNKQIQKRASYKRRRAHNDEDLVDSINKRSEKFNNKLKRFYGEYTEDIKNNLERGTAL